LIYLSETPTDTKSGYVSAKGVVFARKNKVLLLRKPNGEWDLPGGKLKGDESPCKGLRREIYEETGLRIDNAKWIAEFWSTRSDGKQALKAIFVSHLACNPSKSKIAISYEHVDGDFFSLGNIKKLALSEVYSQAISLAAEKVGQ